MKTFFPLLAHSNKDFVCILPSLHDLNLQSIHKTHTSQAGMIYMSELIWFSRIHREIVPIPQLCKPCTKKGKNLKQRIPNNKHTNLINL